jgi:RES domain-containing protein
VIRTGWRIVPEDQAATAFDGAGARLYGGRWNSPGIAVVYASEHQSLATLEVRVHIDRTAMRRPYKCFKFGFDDRLMEVFPRSRLPKEWRQEPPPPSIQQIGDAWIKSGATVILAVPSVVIPNEMNFLINPNHPDFLKIHIEKPTGFTFDLRLS